MPSREAFRIGDFVIYWYGIMIMLGVIAASFIAFREAKRRREDPDHVWGMFPWVLIAGIVGARVGWVIASLGEERMRDPINWIKITEGGLSIHGAVIGGTLAVVLYCRRYRISPFRWFDIIAPGLALAQAIGRWGNYFNQEAFGTKTDLPWGIQISEQRQREVAGIQNPNINDRFHPTFAYEMIWDLINFGLLMWLGRQKKLRLREGDVFWVYVIFYSIGRFLIEELRLDSAMVGGLKTPQVVSIILIVFALGMIVVRNRPGSTAAYSPENLSEEERLAYEAALPAGAMHTGRVSRQTPRQSRVRRIPASMRREEPEAQSAVSGAADGE